MRKIKTILKMLAEIRDIQWSMDGAFQHNGDGPWLEAFERSGIAERRQKAFDMIMDSGLPEILKALAESQMIGVDTQAGKSWGPDYDLKFDPEIQGYNGNQLKYSIELREWQSAGVGVEFWQRVFDSMIDSDELTVEVKEKN
jgi:hypothetical protein